MAQPDSISNGTTPDADKVQAWFTFLGAGKGVKVGTFAVIVAAGTGDDPFWAYATDKRYAMLYTADAAVNPTGPAPKFLIFAQGGG